MPKSRPTSWATAANTSAAEVSRATSVATRRNAACSSARRRAAVRASLLAIAVATSWANSAIRDSVPLGRAAVFEWTIKMPQVRPAITIGVAADERMPSSRTRSSGHVPLRSGRSPSAAHAATIRTESSVTYRPMAAKSAPKNRPISSVIARQSSSAGTSPATSIANRRSVAGSATSGSRCCAESLPRLRRRPWSPSSLAGSTMPRQASDRRFLRRPAPPRLGATRGRAARTRRRARRALRAAAECAAGC